MRSPRFHTRVTAKEDPMYHSPYMLERLSAGHRADRMRDADRGRLLSERRERPATRLAGGGIADTLRAPRAWLADVLLRLAARLSPAHRELVRSRRDSTCAPHMN
jgi:hypothetical protein